MFQNSSKYYDMIYGFKDYKQEAELIRKLIEKVKPDCITILDVACGTAEHNRYLKEYFKIDGMDINPEFIEIAKGKNPEGNYFCCDMTDFCLNKKYDIIMCLFSSIGYVKSLENVKKTLFCFLEHLNDYGRIIIEPWFTPENWKTGFCHMVTSEKDGMKVCRMNLSERKGDVSFFTFHYLIGSKVGIEYFKEYHELGLFSVEEMKQAFKLAELDVEYDPQGISGRGIYTGRRKSDARQ